ncbi:MAG: MATE family efflux transporter [Pseudomonadota bacterium]
MAATPTAEAARDVASRNERRITHGQVLAIAVPIMLSNATTPLVGYVDAVVIGRLGSEVLLGAVALSSNIFNYIFWLFGFLRMGTTGFTAQAAGAEDGNALAAHLVRALGVAGAIGLALVALQWVIAPLALWAMGASDAINSAARTYFDIRIWSAPAALANFALIGWFIGLGRADTAFWIQLALNIVNIVLAIVLTLGLGLGVAGVALSTLIAEYQAAALGVYLALAECRRRGATVVWAHVLEATGLKAMFAVNRDIMIRTVCLLFAFAFMMSQAARTGDLELAAVALLYAMASITIYLLDGFAFAAETLVGQAVGAKSRSRYRAALRLTTIWAAIAALAMALALYVGGGWMIDLASTNADVRAEARTYLMLAALMPLIGVWCFQLDGIFIGATQSVEMRNMMLLSVAIYVPAILLLQAAFGATGLWLGLFVFFVARAATLAWRLPVIEAKFPEGR